MNCPGCNKILASTLSVCPSCGTMMYDSVREELAMKISPLTRSMSKDSGPFELDLGDEISMPVKRQMPPKAEKPISLAPVESKPSAPAAKIEEKIDTTQIASKQTSPTLVGFRHKNTAVPEWRLQLQNAVRKRVDGATTDSAANQTVLNSPRPILQTQGATALKAEVKPEEQPQVIANPKLANALRRIEQSRQHFYTEEKPKPQISPAPVKNYPFTVVGQPAEKQSLAPESRLGEFESKTFLIPEKPKKFDTNKLPALSEVVAEEDFAEVRRPNLKVLKPVDEDITEELTMMPAVEGVFEDEEFDDTAPLSLRFNAGLFDLIIGGFASFILLAPFMIMNGNMFSFQGFFAFAATTAIVMFIYLTTSVALFGRTLGMRLFSLEIIDVEENDYPTFHQAAVNSVVYLFSLAVGGLGFLTILLNEERRAAHDLAAGTIVIKEY